jgi:hypothetical protein
MGKHFAHAITIALMALAILACEKILEPSLKGVLSSYLDASLKGRYKEAYGYVSSMDKAVKSLDGYLSENEEKDNLFAQALVSNVSFNILKLTKTGQRATAEVEITLPDFGVIFKDIMGAAFKSTFGGAEQKEIEQALAKKYESGGVPLATKKETFQLVKEQKKWKVFLDWKTEKIKKEKQAKIQSLLAEAGELKDSKKFYRALEKYEQVLELDSEMVEAKEGVEKTKKEIQAFEEKQAYIGNVVLYDLKARYYATYLNDKVPGVEFKLKNKGNRTLKEVEVTVYFKDSTGAIIAEKTYHPVLVSEYSFSGDNKPLKANYIWQLERGKFYKAESVPSEWKEGAISAKITNIEFDD